MTTIVSVKTLGLGKLAVSKAEGYKAAALAFNKALHAEDVPVEYFKAPSKDDISATKEWARFKSAVVIPSLSAAQQRLIALPSTKGLTDKQKADRKNAQQQVGSRIKDLRNSYSRYLLSLEPKAPRMPSSLNTVLKDLVTKAIEKAQKAEGDDASAALKDVTAFVKELQAAVKLIK